MRSCGRTWIKKRNKLLRTTVIRFLEPCPFPLCSSISSRAEDNNAKPTAFPTGNSLSSSCGSKLAEARSLEPFEEAPLHNDQGPVSLGP